MLGKADRSLACRSVVGVVTRSVVWDFDLAWKFSDCLEERLEVVVDVIIEAVVVVMIVDVDFSTFLDNSPPDFEDSAFKRPDLNSLKSA